jgi:hypothetical protein
MKSIVTIVAAGLLAGAFVVSADAAAKKSGAAQLQAHCQAQGQEEILGHPFPKAARLREELHASEGLGAVCKFAQRKHLRTTAI